MSVLLRHFDLIDNSLVHKDKKIDFCYVSVLVNCLMNATKLFTPVFKTVLERIIYNLNIFMNREYFFERFKKYGCSTTHDSISFYFGTRCGSTVQTIYNLLTYNRDMKDGDEITVYFIHNKQLDHVFIVVKDEGNNEWFLFESRICEKINFKWIGNDDDVHNFLMRYTNFDGNEKDYKELYREKFIGAIPPTIENLRPDIEGYKMRKPMETLCNNLNRILNEDFDELYKNSQIQVGRRYVFSEGIQK